jgi:hypothetical protein
VSFAARLEGCVLLSSALHKGCSLRCTQLEASALKRVGYHHRRREVPSQKLFLEAVHYCFDRSDIAVPTV